MPNQPPTASKAKSSGLPVTAIVQMVASAMIIFGSVGFFHNKPAYQHWN